MRHSEISIEDLASDFKEQAGKCLLVLSEVAEVTRYSIPTIENAIASGDLRIFRRGKKNKRLFHVKDIAKWISGV